MSAERVPARILALLLVLVAPIAVHAAGDNDDDGPLATAREKIDAGDHAGAITELNKLLASDADDADVLNLLGYTHRLTGRYDEALDFYSRALAVEPEHRGANEYLGELYLQRDDLPAAEERLAVLDDACFFGCEEYSDLKAAIGEYRKSNGLD